MSYRLRVKNLNPLLWNSIVFKAVAGKTSLLTADLWQKQVYAYNFLKTQNKELFGYIVVAHQDYTSVFSKSKVIFNVCNSVFRVDTKLQ